MRRTFSCAALFLLSLPSLAATAQTPAAACGAPPAVLTSTQPNIFSEQQEQWLGDAMADMVESEYRPVQDPAENEYLNRIAKRLLAILPPTNIQFRVILVDSPAVNAFSLAGGRIYVMRKLVANARTEDEVASVIAHEMGHILSHQIAEATTADMKRLLGVTSVSDKADVYAKFQRLMDARMTDKHPGPDPSSDEKQNEADTVSVYATAAAGYRPQAFNEWWDRMFFVNGKVGGPLSDFFGITKPESKRLRAILKLVATLPPGCGATQPNDSAEFEKWRALVIANQAGTVASDIKPLMESALTPPLRMALEQLRFSRDGRYILAQDESSIFVLSRDPYQPLFRIDAEDALPAEFTPNSQRVVFSTPGLHTEEWSIADRKLIASHELVSKKACLQSKLSPDGRTLICISVRLDSTVGPMVDLSALDFAALDTSTGSVVYQKNNLVSIPTASLTQWAFAVAYLGKPLDLIRSSLSADGNFLLIGGGKDKLAFDLRTRTALPIGDELKNSVDRAYAFVGNDKVLGEAKDPRDTGIFSFPDGRRIRSAAFRVDDLEPVTEGDYVLSNDVKDNAVGLADVSQAKFIAVSKSAALDVWSGWLTNENMNGGVLLGKIANPGGPGAQSATLPLSPLGGAAAVALSGDGKLLAISSRTRGGVWEVNTGKRILLSRAFDFAFFTADNSLFAEFSKYGKTDRFVARLTFAPIGSTAMPYKEGDDTILASGTLQEWKHPDKKHTELVVRKVDDNSVLWNRVFGGDEFGRNYNLVPGQTILSFPLTSDSAKARLKEAPELAAQAAAVKDKDWGRLIQLIDNSNGGVLGEVVLTVPHYYTGASGVNILGNNLYLSSGDNRTMVYSMDTREQLRQIFGYVIAVDPGTKRICTVNRRDEAIVYDSDGHQLASYHTGSPLRFAHFEQDGKRLLLLTADQQIVQLEAGVTN